MTTETLPGFPANSNPFDYDVYHMGVTIGTNCVVMMENFTTAKCKYLIIVNTVTGERTKVTMGNGKKTDALPEDESIDDSDLINAISLVER